MVSEQDVQNAFNEFNTSFKPAENKEVAEGRSIVTAKTLKIRIDDEFIFEITTKILPKHIRLMSSAKTVYDENTENPNYDSIVEPFAEFMASIVIDKEKYTKQFWIDYDNETGFLCDIVEYVMNTVDHYKPKIESFR